VSQRPLSQDEVKNLWKHREKNVLIKEKEFEMAPLTKEERSERSRKAAETRRKNREAAARREQQEANSTNWNWLPWVLLIIVVLGLLIWRPWATSAAPVPVVPTEVPALLPTPVVEPTQIPVIEPTAIPVVILPINPSIEGKLGTITQQGEYLDTILGKRITFTCRKIVVPDKAWNEELSLKELKSIETTWVDFTISVPEGMFARIFAGGIRQGTNIYNEGVLINLKPGTYEFSLRNGEIVLWYPKQDKFEQDDLVRIFDQIRNGNFDIHSELAFFATTTDLLSTIPADLVQKNKIEIVPALEPITK